MARQRKTNSGNRQSAVDDSLLLRSAESLGRMIGSLQRQLDAARRIATRSAESADGNGHVTGGKRSRAQAKPKIKAKSAAKSKKAAPPRRTATKRKAAKPQR